MKNKLKIVFLFAVLGIAFAFNYANDTFALNDLVLENVEALASSEGHEYWNCYGVGSVNCPGGGKYEYVTGMTNLMY